MQAPDLITFGETMALFMPTEDKSLERASHTTVGFGGAESNVAIGAARLGCSVGWFGQLGDDPFGALIYKALRGEGIDVSRARRVPGEATGLMFRERVAGQSAVHYYRRNSAASLMTPADLDPEYIRASRILHVTGITMALSDSCRQTVLEAVRLAKASGVKVCFDPNLRLKLWSVEEARAALLPLVAEADYFLPGWDELQLLYNTQDDAEIMNRLKALSAVTVVKGRGEETLLLDNGEETTVPFYPADQVVDTVGAGDGFCAGFLAGILGGMSAVEAVRMGSIVGSLVVQMKGDWEALPNRQQVEQRLYNKQWVER